MVLKNAAVGSSSGQTVLIAASAAVIAASYGLVRLAYGLFLPDVQAELGLDTDVAGLISSGAAALYCVAAIIGLLYASKNAKALIIGAAETAGLGAIGMALAPNTAVFVVFAILSSAGAGFASPAVVNILQRNIDRERVGMAQMIANAGGGPGLVAVAILALMLLPNWRLAWGISGVLMLVFCAVVLVYDRAGSGSEGAPRTALGLQWLRQHTLIIVGALLIGIGSGAVWTYARNLLVDAGASSLVSVLAWIGLGVGGTLVILTARWTDRLQPRAAWTLSTAVTAIATAVLALVPTSPVVAIVACIVFGWGYIFCCGVMIIWTIQIDAPRGPAGTALLMILLILGQGVGAGLAGFIAVSAGYLTAFLVAAVISLAATLVVYVRMPGAAR